MTKVSLCRSCRHFHITWDRAFPYGCRAMGFKSHTDPSLVTFQASGQSCLSYEPKSDAPRNNKNSRP